MANRTNDIATTLLLDTPTRRRRRAPLIGMFVVIVLVLAYLGMSMSGRSNAPIYVTVPVATADFDVIVTATGTVEPTNLVEISSELSGTLAKVHVDYNDRVSVGTVLATLDTTKLEAELAVSKAALDAAIARVTMAEASRNEAREVYENAVRLEQRGVTSRQEFVGTEARFIRAQAELQSAKADRALAEANLDLHQAEYDKSCICSPIEGIILDRTADTGQIVASALSAPVLFTVAEDLSQMELRVDIDEADIGQVRMGQQAYFTVDAYDDRRFPAEIVQIRFAPETVDGVVTYKAILTIDNADMLLRPGMTATADINVAEIRNAIVVPNAALRYAPPIMPEKDDTSKERSGLLGMLIPDAPDAGLTRANDRTLWVLDDGAPREVEIVRGASDGKVTEILGGGIGQDDRIIVEQLDG
ncbi:HlyD family secretion protein [Jannaschia faecimaris]|uniref:HlyD family secretion protein n=1 Tax=Jannaschia faecimaris TaxID=1244108 RepID=A0A1H3S8L6_9RHOB|nr:efflux RND transporter periplasmic adaptor subunit [Jannaschia faecimaris]SDZ34302.1 HlyD family secretion protein [Jannaschia faecimaris]